MDFKAIQEMIKSMDNSKLGYLEVNWQGISIVMRKEGESPQEKTLKFGEKAATVVDEVLESKVELEKKVKVEEKAEDKSLKETKQEAEVLEEDGANIKEVVSPIVGTFYGSPSPDKAEFVSVGSKVKKGDTLCIIEAMKLMNEIQSEFDGEIVEILVNNEQMVEYGQSMFKIKVD